MEGNSNSCEKVGEQEVFLLMTHVFGEIRRISALATVHGALIGNWRVRKFSINVQHYSINRTCGKISNLRIFSSTKISSPAGSHVCCSHFVQSLWLNLGLGPGLCPH